MNEVNQRRGPVSSWMGDRLQAGTVGTLSWYVRYDTIRDAILTCARKPT